MRPRWVSLGTHREAPLRALGLPEVTASVCLLAPFPCPAPSWEQRFSPRRSVGLGAGSQLSVPTALAIILQGSSGRPVFLELHGGTDRLPEDPLSVLICSRIIQPQPLDINLRRWTSVVTVGVPPQSLHGGLCAPAYAFFSRLVFLLKQAWSLIGPFKA